MHGRCSAVLRTAVPASLHASLMARLTDWDPLDMAQIGAAIGREFSHALLALVTRETEPNWRRR